MEKYVENTFDFLKLYVMCRCQVCRYLREKGDLYDLSMKLDELMVEEVLLYIEKDLHRSLNDGLLWLC